MYEEIKHLVIKDLKIEIGQKYLLFGALLYVISTVYITYLAFSNGIDPVTWNSMLWIIMLFSAVTFASKSFIQESSGRQLYYHTIVKAQSLILSKIIYNILIITVLSLFTYLMFAVLFGDLVKNLAGFIIILILGSCGFSSVLTFVSAISFKTGNSFILMAILSFPLILPIMISGIKASLFCIENIYFDKILIQMTVLLLLNFLILALSYILFPYIWKD